MPLRASKLRLLASVLLRIAGLNLLMLLALAGFRLAFYLRFGDPTVTEEYAPYLLRVFLLGARYDAVVLAYPVLPLLFALLLPLWRQTGVAWRRWLNLAAVWTTATYAIVLALVVIDHGFYSYYQDHFNILVFGIFEDDTRAVLDTAQQRFSFPVLTGTAVLGVWLLWRLCRATFHAERLPLERPTPRRASAWQFLLAFLLLAAAARGSLGHFPLRARMASVSPHPFLTACALNGPYMLRYAFRHRMEERSGRTAAEAMGFGGAPSAAFSVVLGREAQIESQASAVDLLKSRSPVDDADPSQFPHVLLILMEGMGVQLLPYQSPSFDLLGPATEYFETGTLFNRFLPSDNNTIGSLTALALNLPHRPGSVHVSQSRQRLRAFPTSAPIAFAEAGYETTFLYGGYLSWRQLDSFLPKQGWDRVEGLPTIIDELQLDPSLEENWKIYDEYLFQLIETRLAQAERPQFIVAMTTTNHPPYSVPDTARLPPLQAPQALAQRLTRDADETIGRLRALQYSCHELGRSLVRMEELGLLERTVVGVTGDHNTHDLETFAGDALLPHYGVPFLLLLPSTIRSRFSPDPLMPGSHKDVLPTLYHAAIPGQRHASLGVSLLDNDAEHFGLNAAGIAIDERGAVVMRETGERAYRWSERNPLRLVPAQMAEFEDLLRLRRATIAATDFLLRLE